jgi:hypothetical protein
VVGPQAAEGGGPRDGGPRRLASPEGRAPPPPGHPQGGSVRPPPRRWGTAARSLCSQARERPSAARRDRIAEGGASPVRRPPPRSFPKLDVVIGSGDLPAVSTEGHAQDLPGHAGQGGNLAAGGDISDTPSRPQFLNIYMSYFSSSSISISIGVASWMRTGV